ncbi:4Fe-4S dicluster domain-containing protein [Chloroflexota bacterium]
MVTSEVIINEKRCRGCGYCVQFCPRECLKIYSNKISRFGYTMPMLISPEQCNTCGFCAQMCPHWAVEVNLVTDTQGKDIVREKIAGPPRLALTPPVANCGGCQRPTVGRIIAEVLDELMIGDKTMAIDAISCGGCSAFSLDFGYVSGPFEHPTDITIATKRAHPYAVVFTVLDNGIYDVIGLDSLINALICGENITVISCNGASYGPWPMGWHVAPMNTWITTTEGRELVVGKYPLHTAELAATFAGVAYSARGAVASPDDYQLTKSYIKTAFQKQLDNIGLSFVEVLCACNALSYEPPLGCLEWIHDEMVREFPLGEYKNVDQVQ